MPDQDEGFHEIQLNGKQVVFLFMAATVVSVVIFLCGVLVGRGVRAERGLMTDSGSGSAVAETTPPPQPQPAPAATPAGSDPRAAAPPPADDELSYFTRLGTKAPAREQLKPETDKSAEKDKAAARNVVAKGTVEKSAPEKNAAEKPAPAEKPVTEKIVAAVERPAAPPPAKEPARVPAAMPAAAPAAAPVAPAAASAPSADEAAASGFAVQVAALNVRGDAETIARRLSSKGYTAYVLLPTDGTPAVYRVRIGKFPTRREADTIAAKLKKEEQFNPWVTR